MENTELEESSMNGVSNRKKSFLDELIRNYANFIMVLAGILYFTIAGIIGNAVLKSGNMSTRVIKGMVCGLVIICLAGIIIYAIEAIENARGKIEAIKSYCYLPFTEEELKRKIEDGVFENSDDYIEYICRKLRYGFEKTIYFTKKDMIQLCTVFEKVYNKPIVLSYENYLNMDLDMLPFGYNDDIRNLVEYICLPHNYFVILCTDNGLAESVINDADLEDVRYIIYNVCTDKKSEKKVDKVTEVEINSKIFTGKVGGGKTTEIIDELERVISKRPQIKIYVYEEQPEIKKAINKKNIVNKLEYDTDLIVIGQCENLPMEAIRSRIYDKPIWLELCTAMKLEVVECNSTYYKDIIFGEGERDEKN